MSAVSDITTIELTTTELWDKHHLVSSGAKIDESVSDTVFFKKITLYIPETYLSSDKEAKIREIISTITKYNRELLSHQMNEKKFLISKPGEGNCENQHILSSYIKHTAIFIESLKQMDEKISRNGITYKIEY
ncbi:MAG: hypothetical protein KR126chlam4_00025 [Candidatus Anoxychlamydiales bacterium]|uniref:Uncharacterized protein n=1 Tax=marine sediment metagenome TaxID=412755 RepID=A0A0F9HY84_9ZZZZ|nr:hypothetical protein [Candidatus Anoxychlamydiales bacterium]NGX40208.1 hypothetical protein [Candidatus Anoxychlamydiales bacterium]HEU64236.1 hypothetical protein [Chlamydiota bacterium]